MNRDFIYHDGKATILEDNGNQKEIDYYDKLEEVLERENLIEVLERKSTNLISKIDDINRDYENSRKKYIDSLVWILFPLIIFFLSLIFNYFFDIDSINTSIGTFNFGVIETFFTSLLTTPVGIILANSNYKYRASLQEKIQSKKNEIKKIERQITLQKKELDQLKKDKINTSEDNYFVTRLNTGPNFSMTRNMNLERILSYFNQDLIISDKEEVFEEKAPVLKKTLK